MPLKMIKGAKYNTEVIFSDGLVPQLSSYGMGTAEKNRFKSYR
jgi:hypothetical protein